MYEYYLNDVGNKLTDVPIAEVDEILPIQTYNDDMINVVKDDEDQYKAIPHVPANIRPKTVKDFKHLN